MKDCALTTARIQQQDYKFQETLLSGIWRWTTRVDVSKSAPCFEVRDVISPYGTLADRTPIPGTIIQAMADSISQIQSSFTPTILLSSSSLSFTLNQGQGMSAPASVTITNGGVFGSLLATTLTTSAPWLVVTPANVTGLAAGESGTTSVTVDSTSLLASGSPYSGTVLVQSQGASNNPQTINVSVTVLPLATITLSPAGLSFYVSAPVPPNPYSPVPSQTFTISNTGPTGSQLSYLVQKLIGCSPWLVSYTPFQGNLASTQSQNVTVGVAPPCGMVPGTYTETLRVSGYSTNMTQDIPVTLTIT